MNTPNADKVVFLRTGLHIEKRPGMVNFSVVGRNATLGERKLYARFDSVDKERIRIAKEFKIQFPNLEAVLAAKQALIFSQKVAIKAQIVKDFDPKNDVIQFFGDAMQPRK